MPNNCLLALQIKVIAVSFMVAKLVGNTMIGGSYLNGQTASN